LKDETANWLNYAEENLEVAKLSFERGYLNPCLQNCQQAVEKYLKTILVELGHRFQKTHSIAELHAQLSDIGINVPITREDCALMDSIYLPSKYPVTSVLPDTHAYPEVCSKCIQLAEIARTAALRQIHGV
jgi:HEPN domain-containing protein